MAKIKTAKDLIIQLCYASNCAPIIGKVRLMKMAFLFDKEIRKEFNKDKNLDAEILPDFKPYSFGPFSEKIFDDLEFLVNLGFISVDETDVEDDDNTEQKEKKYWSARGESSDDSDESNFPERFRLTEIGRKFVEQEKAGGKLSAEQKKLMDEFKHRCTKVSLKVLLKYVYSKYPKFTKESKIRDEILA